MNNQTLPGLYIHIPFCLTKCPYCDFYSEPSTDLIPAWLHAFKKEALLYKDRFPLFDTLYLGGGTPSVLDESLFASVMEHILKHFHFNPDSEITVEANPNDITKDKLRRFQDLGINRISLGVQSFAEKELSCLKRRHTAVEAEQALALTRAAGFSNIGIDLMYAIPGQTEAMWIKTLEQALSFQPEHLSCYQLTVAEGTVFWEVQEQGNLQLPDEAEGEAFFMITSELLEEQGYVHYEISNFARGENYLSRHNQKYWHQVPYLGLGPAAHSFQDGSRWWNYRSVKKYCEVLEDGNAPVEGAEHLSEDQLSLESLYLGLRTRAGVDLKQFRAKQKLDTVLTGLCKSDYVKIINGRVVPTRKGFLVADRLPLLFI